MRANKYWIVTTGLQPYWQPQLQLGDANQLHKTLCCQTARNQVHFGPTPHASATCLMKEVDSICPLLLIHTDRLFLNFFPIIKKVASDTPSYLSISGSPWLLFCISPETCVSFHIKRSKKVLWDETVLPAHLGRSKAHVFFIPLSSTVDKYLRRYGTSSTSDNLKTKTRVLEKPV